MDIENETPLTILKRLITAIEKQNNLLECDRNTISNIWQQLEKQNQRLQKLENSNFFYSTDFLNQTNTTSIADIIAQLKAIADTAQEHT